LHRLFQRSGFGDRQTPGERFKCAPGGPGLFAIPRTTLARHAAHAAQLGTKFAVLEGQGGPERAGGPLEEALGLAARARTPRERLRALEQVRRATKLALRGTDADAEDLARLDRNVAEAEAAYRDARDFETQARALSGWRESITERLDAVKVADPIAVSQIIALSGGEPLGEPTTQLMPAELYWRGIPRRLRNPVRYGVARLLRLRLDRAQPDEVIEVRERQTDALVWKSERRSAQ
jgi:hypothetical protein